MDIKSTQGKEIIRVIKAAGKTGITKAQISRTVSDKGCDCENWVKTLLEAGIIEKCGELNGADLYRIVG